MVLTLKCKTELDEKKLKEFERIEALGHTTLLMPFHLLNTSFFKLEEISKDDHGNSYPVIDSSQTNYMYYEDNSLIPVVVINNIHYMVFADDKNLLWIAKCEPEKLYMVKDSSELVLVDKLQQVSEYLFDKLLKELDGAAFKKEYTFIKDVRLVDDKIALLIEIALDSQRTKTVQSTLLVSLDKSYYSLRQLMVEIYPNFIQGPLAGNSLYQVSDLYGVVHDLNNIKDVIVGLHTYIVASYLNDLDIKREEELTKLVEIEDLKLNAKEQV